MTATGAAALGLGSYRDSAVVLGQPLNFAVQVRLAPGETLEARCLAATVSLGDRALAAGAVRTLLEFTGAESARVRVLTAVNVDEPVVTVALTAGCGTRVTRNFVLFADPPELPYAAVLAAAQAPVAVAVAVPVGAMTGSGRAGSAGDPATDSAGHSAGGAIGAMAAVQAGVGATAAPVAPVAATDRPTAADPPTAATRAAAVAEMASPPDPAAARRAAEVRARAQAERAARAERRRAQREAAAARRAEAARAAALAPPAPAQPDPRPRLRLDGPQPLPSAEAQAVEQAIEAVAQAASVARAMAAAASASEQRMAALERTVAELQGEARANAQANVSLQAQLAETRGAERWIGPLWVALVVLGALAAWLAWRLAELQRLRQAGWREAAARGRSEAEQAALKPESAQQALADPPSQQMTRPIPFVTSELAPATGGPAGLRPRTAPAWPPPVGQGPDTVPGPAMPEAAAAGLEFTPADAGVAAKAAGVSSLAAATAMRASLAAADTPDPAMQRTEVLPPSLQPGQTATRDVSIEELIDLEQQAEFFVVLGQDDSAIDLLVDHLRNTGGGSPLPYLKLLEIYRRQGDRDAYERTRTRFNQRFNAYAPDWDTDLLHGRSLEEYEGVVPRLQEVWPRPLDAMAELEALLFRKSRGELFDLPAYREVLFLYALARDLLDRESLDSGTVDLLLPLSSGLVAAAAGAGAVSPATLDLELVPSVQGELATAPIDLDLSLAEQRTSIFDQLDDPPTRPHEE